MTTASNDLKTVSGFVWSIAEILRGDFKQRGTCLGVPSEKRGAYDHT